jgi:hypothetical protein
MARESLTQKAAKNAKYEIALLTLRSSVSQPEGIHNQSLRMTNQRCTMGEMIQIVVCSGRARPRRPATAGPALTSRHQDYTSQLIP